MNAILFEDGAKYAQLIIGDSKYLARRLSELMERCPGKAQIIREEKGDIHAQIPVRWVRLNPPYNIPDEEHERYRVQGIKNLHNGRRKRG